jgi:acetolactate synthase-1/2/3 large subunit
MAFTDAAAELVATLADEGVQHLFINPGTDTAPVQEALAAARTAETPSPRAVLCTHEFIALSSAMGHYFVTGAPQAVMVHVDAGTLNLGGAWHNAQRNRLPVVVFAGRSPYTTATEIPGHRDSPIHWQQEQLDQQAIARAFGKWFMEVPRGRELGPIVRRAFQVAQSDPRGPAYVTLPREALMEPGGTDLARRLRPPRRAAPDPSGLTDMARALAGARRPVIITNRTGAWPDAVASLVEIAELLGAPVLDQRDRVNFPSRHPLYAGDAAADVLASADVVLLLDSEVPWIPALTAPPADATVLQIDIDPAKATMPLWTYPVDLALTADTSVALPMLADALRHLASAVQVGQWAERREQVAGQLAQIRQQWDAFASSNDPAAAPHAMMQALNKLLPPHAIVLEEAVTSRSALIRQIDREPGSFFDTGSPALGWAIGGAMGVKLARPEAPVFAVCGDGSFGFGVPTAAFWSAHRAGAPFIAVILNNQSYRASRLPVGRLYPGGAGVREGSFPEADLSPTPDYVGLAAAYGGGGRVVSDGAQLADAVQYCLALEAGGRCAVLDIRLPAA